MRLFLKFTSGPLKGKGIPIKRSMSIGRKGTDLEIDDSKLSQIHAFIQPKGPDTWLLVDNNSRNGIRVDGKKVQKVLLEDGLEFQLGTSIVQCRRVDEKKDQLPDTLNKWLREGALKVRNKPMKVAEITPQVNLRFIEGVQYGTVWEIFYGPREAGLENLDLCLFDDNLPEKLFVIESINNEPFLRTKHSHLLQINGKHLDSKMLTAGDILEFGETKILVEKAND